MKKVIVCLCVALFLCSCGNGHSKFASIQDAEQSYTSQGYKILCSDDDNFVYLNSDSIFVFHKSTQVSDYIPDEVYSKAYIYEVDVTNPTKVSAQLSKETVSLLSAEKIRNILINNQVVAANEGSFIFTVESECEMMGTIESSYLLNFEFSDSIQNQAQLIQLAYSNPIDYNAERKRITIPAYENRCRVPSSYDESLLPNFTNPVYVEQYQYGNSICSEIKIDLKGNILDIEPQFLLLGTGENITINIREYGEKNLIEAILSSI